MAVKLFCAVILILSMYNSMRNVIVVSVYRKRRADIAAFLPQMTQTDYNEQVNTNLEGVERIYHGVLFSYERLREYRPLTPDELDGEVFRMAVRVPFDLGKDNGRETRRIKDEELSSPPTALMSGGSPLDDGTVLKIYKALR